jgi:hypothetical protein
VTLVVGPSNFAVLVVVPVVADHHLAWVCQPTGKQLVKQPLKDCLVRWVGIYSLTLASMAKLMQFQVACLLRALISLQHKGKVDPLWRRGA